MTTTTKYCDFTITENAEGWLVECYDTEHESAVDIQIQYWDFMKYIRGVKELRKSEAIAWIADPENTGAVNDLLSNFVNEKH